MATWDNRIVESGEVAVAEVIDNPRNWRLHDSLQQSVLEDVIDQVGLVSHIIVNRRTGFLVDGHLRVLLARKRGEETLPAVFVDLSEEVEAKVLLTHDTLADGSLRDTQKYSALRDQLDQSGLSLAKLLGHAPDLDIPDGDDILPENNLPVESAADPDSLDDDEPPDLHAAEERVTEVPVRLGEGFEFTIDRAVFEKWRDAFYQEVGHADEDIAQQLMDLLGMTPFAVNGEGYDADADFTPDFDDEEGDDDDVEMTDDIWELDEEDELEGDVHG